MRDHCDVAARSRWKLAAPQPEREPAGGQRGAQGWSPTKTHHKQNQNKGASAAEQGWRCC